MNSDTMRRREHIWAIKIGSYWAIQGDAEKPKDERIKTGKYIKGDRQHI